jgi:hypothetical protein
MEMHILSDSQHKELTASIAAIQTLLANSTNVVLDAPAPAAAKSVNTVTNKVKARKAKGTGRGVSVLNEVKVLEIKRQLAAGGKSVAKIARDFGVHMTTINCIKSGKTWKHVQLNQEIATAAE